MSLPSPAVPEPDRALRLQRYFPAIVVAVGILTYIASFRFDFVYDDQQQIINNPLIRSWHYLPAMFKTDVWRFWFPGAVGNYWRPLFMTWLLVNFKTFGLNAIGWHITAVLVHAAATYLVYRLIKRVSNDALVALAAASIFAVHPVHMETVAWISGATDSLMAVFFISSLLCFIEGHEGWRNRPRWFAASALLFGLSLLCKETAAVLPLIAIGYVVLIPCRGDSGMPRFRSLFLALPMYAAVFAGYWAGRSAALAGITHSRWELGVTTLLMTWPSLLWFYIAHSFWPIGLSVFYDRPPVFHADWAHFWAPVLGVAAVICGFVLVIPRNLRRQASFAALIFLVPLTPAFVFPALVPTDYAHDRYLYLSCLGFAWLIAIVIQRLATRRPTASFGARPVLAAIVIVIALSAATSAQIVYWANNVLLFNRATRIAPANVMGFTRLGYALIAVGRTEEATAIFRQVAKVDPNDWLVFYNLGLADFLHGNYPEAEDFLRRSAQSHPSAAQTFALLGDVLNKESKFVEAERAARSAMAIRPERAGYRRVLAESLKGQGNDEQALQEIRSEVQAHPDDEPAVALLQRWQSEALRPGKHN